MTDAQRAIYGSYVRLARHRELAIVDAELVALSREAIARSRERLDDHRVGFQRIFGGMNAVWEPGQV